MGDDVDDELHRPIEVENERNDPAMTLFIVGIGLAFLICALLLVIANARPPAGL